MSKSKEVMKKPETTLSVGNAEFDAEALAVFAETGNLAGNDIDMNDVFIPKVQLCQSNSEIVQDGKAGIGEYVNSVNGKILGREVGIFVLKIEKYYQIFEAVMQNDGKIKQEYIEKIPRVGNSNLPKTETTPEGKEIIRTKLTTMFCILEQDLVEGQPTIYQIDFRKTSFGTGMEIMSELDALTKIKLPNGKFGLASNAKCFMVGSQKKKNADDQPYLIKSLESSRWASSPEVIGMKVFAQNIVEYLASKEEHVAPETVNEDDFIETVSRPVNQNDAQDDDMPF